MDKEIKYFLEIKVQLKVETSPLPCFFSISMVGIYFGALKPPCL